MGHLERVRTPKTPFGDVEDDVVVAVAVAAAAVAVAAAGGGAGARTR
jgi:tellurite resistance protein